MSLKIYALLIAVHLISSSESWAASSSVGANSTVATAETPAAIAVYDEEEDFESEFISDFELADAPDPELRKFKDPEYVKEQYKRGRMAFLFGQYDAAYKIMLPLAENGDSKSQATIGWMYHIGKGKKKDLREAFSWYEKSAKQNHPVALNNIGVFYEQGLFVGKSAKTAAKWYKESAEWGYPYAQYNLGVLYHEGRGVKKDPKEAQFWLQIAALQGVDQAVEVLKKISGKVHEGNPLTANKTDDTKGPKWHSSKKTNTTSENPHTSSQYKNIADRIKSTRASDDFQSNTGGDFLKPPPDRTQPKSKAPASQDPKPVATADSTSVNDRNGNDTKSNSKRVESNFKTGDQFEAWLSDAQVAQKKLAEQKLLKEKTNSHMLEIFNDDWVHARNKNHYTIQLAKSEDLDGLLKMARKQPMLKETAYYTSMENGKKWYNLVYGNFKDKKSATTEIKNLPKSVKQWSPKVRRFSDVQANMSLDAPKSLIKNKHPSR